MRAMVQGRSTLFVGAFLAVAAASATAAEGQRIPVSVEAVGVRLVVRVMAPTTVRGVLEALCQRLETRCSLPAGAAEIPAHVGEFAGTWTEVVADLLQGSGLGYAATPAAPGRAALLVVEGPAGHDVSRATPADQATPSGFGDSAASTLAEVAETSEAAPLPDSAAEAAPATPVGAEGSPLILDAKAAGAVPGQGTAATPFANPDGSPVLARLDQAAAANASAGGGPGWAVLPFADGNGKPMVTSVTNQPVTQTPFAGPDGQPWPAPPPQQDQKLQYPIPPTPQAQPKPENP